MGRPSSGTGGSCRVRTPLHGPVTGRLRAASRHRDPPPGLLQSPRGPAYWPALRPVRGSPVRRHLSHPRSSRAPDATTSQQARDTDPSRSPGRTPGGALLTAFGRAFKTPDLRRKLLFTLAIIGVYRLGSVVPGPGVSYVAIQSCLDQVENDSLYGLVNLFSGGALLQLSVFALGIMPYITSSIIVQLLVVVIPRLETLKQEGQSGQAKLTQYTRYLTVALAILQSTGIVALARSGRLFPSCNEAIIPDDSLFRILVLVITLTAGTAVIMWLGELITDRGVGNGMSVLIFTSIISSIPAQAYRVSGQENGAFVLSAIALLAMVVITLVVFVEQAQRRIPVQYAKRMIGRRMYGGTSTYIPLKVNQAGVIPVIFASSLLYLPQLVIQLMSTKTQTTNPVALWITRHYTDTSALGGPYYIITYF